MLRYRRIEVIKRTIYVPIYRESYEVQTMRPNRPMQSKFGMSKTQANAYSKRMLALLKGKSSQKRKGRDLQTLPTLLDIGYLLLFYIAAYLYCRIPISILSYRCILV